jgi:carboxyl-terminal processing protease
MTAKTRLVVFLVSLPIFAFAAIGGMLGRAIARDETYPHLGVFEDVLSLINSNYVEDVNTTKLMHGALQGLADALDPDSAYLTAPEVKQHENLGQQPAGELGLELTRQYWLRVIAARDGSPAARAGLRPGDFVRIIDKQATREMSVWEGTRRLRGKPGTTITLTVLRGNAAEPHVVDLTRETLTPLAPTSRMLANGVGYVRIGEFRDRTGDDLKSRVADLTRQGASRLVIDLRSTARGPLESGVAAARLFVSSGTLAVLDTKSQPRQTIGAVAGDGSIKVPTALLIDEGTAGAAELFAAALAGNKRAELVGAKTHGRSALQKLVKLPDASALWISHGWYLTPAATAVHEKGISPTIEVESPDVDFGATAPAQDAALDKAIERLTAKSAA